MLLLIKKVAAAAMIAVNLMLLVQAFVAVRRKSPLAPTFYQRMRAVAMITMVPVAIGFYLLAIGAWPTTGMHIFYGVMVGLAALGQLVLSGEGALALSYRSRPIAPAILLLASVLLALRSWMAG